jgi:hypothetical protein
MIHDIPKPKISSNFTIEDIHKIRAWNYERTKDATSEEYAEDMNRRGAKGLERIEEIRRRTNTRAV